MENNKISSEVNEQSAPVAPERCNFPEKGINEMQFARMKNNRRMINRRGTTLVVEASVHCTALCNLFFKALSANPDNYELQATELNRLNELWKKWLRSRTDKFVFKESAPFFIEKIHFMMGDSKTIQAEIDKIKSLENLES